MRPPPPPSLNESDNAVLIAGLSRMKLTDKTTQEYLNYFSERGIDVYEAPEQMGQRRRGGGEGDPRGYQGL